MGQLIVADENDVMRTVQTLPASPHPPVHVDGHASRASASVAASAGDDASTSASIVTSSPPSLAAVGLDRSMLASAPPPPSSPEKSSFATSLPVASIPHAASVRTSNILLVDRILDFQSALSAASTLVVSPYRRPARSPTVDSPCRARRTSTPSSCRGQERRRRRIAAVSARHGNKPANASARLLLGSSRIAMPAPSLTVETFTSSIIEFIMQSPSTTP